MKRNSASPQSVAMESPGVKTLLAVMLIMTLPALVSVARVDATAATLEIERIAVFKNGLGYFSSRATLPQAATTVELGELPVPSHGTLWVGYDEKTPVRGLFARLEQVVSEVPVDSVAGLLAANVGRSVTLDPGSITGTLLAVTADVVLVRTPKGTVAVALGSVTRAMVAGDEVGSTRTVEATNTVLRLELTRPAAGAAVEVDYLAKGITWAPSYRIDLSDPKVALFSAKAVVVNEVADLEDVELDLITGFPNLMFADVASPMAPGQTLEGFFQALRQRRQQRSDHSVVMQQRALNVLPSGSHLPHAYSTATEGRESEDLFLCPVQRLTLRRGETAWLPLFTAEMPYEHVYTWEIPDFLDREERYRYGQPEEPREEKVYHACRLTNAAGVPLTTAPAQFVRNGQIVGQDLSHYTNPGSATTIRINRALGLVAEQAEIETSRERQAVRLHGNYYDKVGIRGELKLRNLLGKSARLEVTKSLSGEVDATSDDPERTRTAKGLRAANSTHRLLWRLDLKAGEEKSISYEYTVLVRH